MCFPAWCVGIRTAGRQETWVLASALLLVISNMRNWKFCPFTNIQILDVVYLGEFPSLLNPLQFVLTSLFCFLLFDQNPRACFFYPNSGKLSFVFSTMVSASVLKFLPFFISLSLHSPMSPYPFPLLLSLFPSPCYFNVPPRHSPKYLLSDFLRLFIKVIVPHADSSHYSPKDFILNFSVFLDSAIISPVTMAQDPEFDNWVLYYLLSYCN